MLRELITLRNDYENLYREVLRAGVAQGELDVPNIEIASRALMGALNGLVDWYRIRPDQSEGERDALARALAHAVVHVMRGRVPGRVRADPIFVHDSPVRVNAVKRP